MLNDNGMIEKIELDEKLKDILEVTLKENLDSEKAIYKITDSNEWKNAKYNYFVAIYNNSYRKSDKEK